MSRAMTLLLCMMSILMMLSVVLLVMSLSQPSGAGGEGRGPSTTTEHRYNQDEYLPGNRDARRGVGVDTSEVEVMRLLGADSDDSGVECCWC